MYKMRLAGVHKNEENPLAPVFDLDIVAVINNS
jgi:hypothetical protein